MKIFFTTDRFGTIYVWATHKEARRACKDHLMGVDTIKKVSFRNKNDLVRFLHDALLYVPSAPTSEAK